MPLRLIALAVVACALAACTPDPAPPATGAGAAPTGPVTLDAASAAAVPEARPDLGAFRIVQVLLGKGVGSDNVVVADATVFGRKDRIHASVLSTGASQGLRLSARWLAPDGEVIADTAQPLVPSEATATTFSINNSKPWPVGKYQLLIAVNGHTEQTRTFQVR